MKPMRTFGIFLLMLLLLTSCSVGDVLERGNGVLDKMFAGEHIPSTPQQMPSKLPPHFLSTEFPWQSPSDDGK